MSGQDTIYQMITDQVLKALSEGQIPWRKPWNASVNGPRNYVSNKPYRGVNVWLLLLKDYASPYWLTMKQANQLGGKVRAGESATVVIFWKISHGVDKATGEKKTFAMLRYYRVFNIEQTEGVRVIDRPAPETVNLTPIEAAEKIIANYPGGPEISFSGSSAYYTPTTDKITVPPMASYTKTDEFYSTVFHEQGHSTGAKHRLHRFDGADSFGSHEYGREELVAEMTAAYLCAESGILPNTIENSAAYLRGWMKTIGEDPRAVIVAAGKAQRAADLILGRSFGDREGDE
jgi:antirestriction protein ArdC